MSNTNNQTLLNPNVVSEEDSIATNTNNNQLSSLINNNESNIKTRTSFVSPVSNQEPIEIYQLLPKNENINDNWWKQALNKQHTFSIDDIGEWPEYEQDPQYTVQIKRVLPVKLSNEKENFDKV